MIQQVTCPGFGLSLPADPRPLYDGYYTASPECWSLYTEVLGREFSRPSLFGQVHQLTVDGYAVQHAGGVHKDKSVVVHLLGLHLALEREVPVVAVAPLLQRVAGQVSSWPHFDPPADTGPLTVWEVALAASDDEHARAVRAWAEQLWAAWQPVRPRVLALAEQHLNLA